MPPESTPAPMPSPMGGAITTVTHNAPTSSAPVDITAKAPIPGRNNNPAKDRILGPKDALKDPKSKDVVKVKGYVRKAKPKAATPKSDLPPAAKVTVPKTEVTAPVDEPASVVPAIVGEPAATPVPAPTPAPVAKVKIGDEELTPEEIKTKMDELRAKAEAAAKPPEPEPAPVAEPTEEERAAAEKQKEDEFIARVSGELTDIDQDKWDAMIADPEGWKQFNAIRAADQLRQRKWFASAVNDKLKELDDKIAPLLDTNKTISEYKNDTTFARAFPDIEGHPKGMEEARNVRKMLQDRYDQAQQKIAQGTATRRDQIFALQYEELTPQEFNEDVASHVRERLKIGQPSPAPTAVPVAAPAAVATPKPPAPAPKPPGGQAPVGASATKSLNDQQSHVALMKAKRLGLR